MSVPESFLFRILHNSLNELGFNGIADQLIDEVHKKGLFVDNSDHDLLFSSKKAKLYQWITRELYQGRYDTVLGYLDECTELYQSDVDNLSEKSPNLVDIINGKLDDINGEDLVSLILVVKYLIKRTVFLQKLVDFSLNRDTGARATNNSLIQYLSDELGPLLDTIDPTNHLVTQLFNNSILSNLNREAESSKLLSLVMQSPLTDYQIQNLVFTSDIILCKVQVEDNSRDYFVGLVRKTLVKGLFNDLFAGDFYESALPYSNFQIPPYFLNKIINDSVLYTQSQTPHFLPDRSGSVQSFIPPIETNLRDHYKPEFPSSLLKTLKGHTGEVWACKFSPSGRFLVTGAADSQLIIYDVKRNFEVVETLISDNNLDRQHFVNSTYKPYTSKKSIIYCAWDPNEDYIVSGSLDTRFRVWSVKHIKNRARPLTGRTTRSSDSGLSSAPEEDKLVSCFILEAEKIRTWSCEFLPTQGGIPQFIIGSPDKVLKAFDINGTELYDFYSNLGFTSDKEDSTMKEEDSGDEDEEEDPNDATSDESDEDPSSTPSTQTRSMRSSSEYRDYSYVGQGPGISSDLQVKDKFNRINDICITPNGKILITANENKQVAFYSVPDFKDVESSTRKIATLTLHGRLSSCSVTSDGQYLLLSLSPNELQIWDIKDLEHDKKPVLFKKLVGHTHFKYMIRSCFGYNFNGQEQLALSGGDDGDIHIWKVNTGTLVTSVKGHQNVCNSVSWNNGYKVEDPSDVDYGKLWCSVGDDKLVQIWGPPGFYE